MAGSEQNNDAAAMQAASRAALAERLKGLSIPRDQRPGGGTAFEAASPRVGTPPSAPVVTNGSSVATPPDAGSPRTFAAGTARPAANYGTYGGGVRWGRWIGLGVLAAAGAGLWTMRGAIGNILDKLTDKSAATAEGGIPLLVVTEQAGGGPPPVLLAGGKIVSDRKVFVSTKVNGQILRMFVDQNDFVEAGKTVIAEIEDIDYKARLRQAEAGVTKAKADVERLGCEVERAGTDRTKAEAEVARAKALLATAEADIVKAAADVLRTRSEVDRAKADAHRYKVLSDNATAKLRDVEKFYVGNSGTPFELRDARADSDAVTAQLRFAEAQVVTAQRQHEWTIAAKTAIEGGLAAAKSTLAAAEAGLSAADHSIGKAKADVKVAEAAVAAAEAVRDQELKRVNDCRVLAPITGVVLERSANVGDYVTEGGGRGGIANSQFVTLADTDNLRVEVDVTEQDISKIGKGMPCTIIPDAFKDRRFSGHVMWIDPIGNYSKATVQVKVRINKTREDDRHLRIEGAVKVEFREPPKEGAKPASDKPSIYIPKSAVSPDGRVQLVDAGKVRAVAIKTGGSAGAQVEVLDGLKRGDSIVRDYSADLKDGDVVRPPGK